MAVAFLMTGAGLVWIRASLPRGVPGEYIATEPLIVTWITKRSPVPVERAPASASPNDVTRVRSSRIARSASAPTAASTPPSASQTPRPLVLKLPDANSLPYRVDPMRRARNELAAVSALPGLTVRDSSFLARLGGMSTASACGELRALLKRGGFDAPHPEVLLRSMQSRGCAP